MHARPGQRHVYRWAAGEVVVIAMDKPTLGKWCGKAIKALAGNHLDPTGGEALESARPGRPGQLSRPRGSRGASARGRPSTHNHSGPRGRGRALGATTARFQEHVRQRCLQRREARLRRTRRLRCSAHVLQRHRQVVPQTQHPPSAPRTELGELLVGRRVHGGGDAALPPTQLQHQPLGAGWPGLACHWGHQNRQRQRSWSSCIHTRRSSSRAP